MISNTIFLDHNMEGKIVKVMPRCKRCATLRYGLIYMFQYIKGGKEREKERERERERVRGERGERERAIANQCYGVVICSPVLKEKRTSIRSNVSCIMLNHSEAGS